MLFNTAFIVLAGSAFLAVDAVPVVASAATTTPLPFASSCTNITYRPAVYSDHWLVGNCLTGQGTTRIQSALYIPAKITLDFKAKQLQWKKKASDPNFRCNGCELRNGSTLWCKTCFDDVVNYFESSLKLDSHIANYGGHLLSNLSGPPTIPTTDISPPTSFRYTLEAGGLSTNRSDQVCGGDIYGEKRISGPLAEISCLTNPKWTFERLSVSAAPGKWGVEVFDNKDCIGTPIQRIEDRDIADVNAPNCVQLKTTGVAVKVSMLWNGDMGF